MNTTRPAPQLAVHCQFLNRSVVSTGADQATTLCMHPAREGRACVGPFLEDLTTSCGLWERNPQSHLIPLPQPERWQGRRRREAYLGAPPGWDSARGWR